MSTNPVNTAIPELRCPRCSCFVEGVQSADLVLYPRYIHNIRYLPAELSFWRTMVLDPCRCRVSHGFAQALVDELHTRRSGWPPKPVGRSQEDQKASEWLRDLVVDELLPVECLSMRELSLLPDAVQARLAFLADALQQVTWGCRMVLLPLSARAATEVVRLGHLSEPHVPIDLIDRLTVRKAALLLQGKLRFRRINTAAELD